MVTNVTDTFSHLFIQAKMTTRRRSVLMLQVCYIIQHNIYTNKHNNKQFEAGGRNATHTRQAAETPRHARGRQRKRHTPTHRQPQQQKQQQQQQEWSGKFRLTKQQRQQQGQMSHPQHSLAFCQPPLMRPLAFVDVQRDRLELIIQRPDSWHQWLRTVFLRISSWVFMRR